MVQSQDRLKELVMAEDRMRIGKFAKEVGISVDAVRFYERRGVLRPAPRTSGGYRTFGQRDLDRVSLAKEFQQLGLTIDEVVDALSAHDDGDTTCASERWRLERVEARIEAQMAALRRTRRQVRDALAACEAGRCQLTTETSPDAQA